MGSGLTPGKYGVGHATVLPGKRRLAAESLSRAAGRGRCSRRHRWQTGDFDLDSLSHHGHHLELRPRRPWRQDLRAFSQDTRRTHRPVFLRSALQARRFWRRPALERHSRGICTGSECDIPTITILHSSSGGHRFGTSSVLDRNDCRPPTRCPDGRCRNRGGHQHDVSLPLLASQAGMGLGVSRPRTLRPFDRNVHSIRTRHELRRYHRGQPIPRHTATWLWIRRHGNTERGNREPFRETRQGLREPTSGATRNQPGRGCTGRSRRSTRGYSRRRTPPGCNPRDP